MSAMLPLWATVITTDQQISSGNQNLSNVIVRQAGNLTVTNPGTILTVAGTDYMMVYNGGRVNIINGATLNVDSGDSEYNSAVQTGCATDTTGSLTVSGAGTKMNVTYRGSNLLGTAINNRANFTLSDRASLNATTATSGITIWSSGEFLATGGSTINLRNDGNASIAYGVYATGGNFTLNGASTFNVTHGAGFGVYAIGSNFTVSDAGTILNIISTNTSAGTSLYNTNNATLTVNRGATVTVTNFGSTGLFNLSKILIDGAGSSLDIDNASPTRNIVNQDSGTITVSGGAFFNSTITGGSGINNSANILLTSGGTLRSVSSAGVGVYNTGTFIVRDGGLLDLDVGDEGYGFQIASSSGNLTVSNATLNITSSGGNGIFGFGGRIILDSGSNMTVTSPSGNGVLLLGNFLLTGGSVATFNVGSGGGNGILNTNQGNFTVNNGAKLGFAITGSGIGNGIYNSGDGGVSTFIVEGIGSTLNMIKASTDGDGIYNDGIFRIRDSASATLIVNSGNGIRVGTGSNSNFYLSNATLDVNNRGTGNAIINEGTLFIEDGAILTSLNNQGNGIYNGAGGTFYLSNATLGMLNTGTGNAIVNTRSMIIKDAAQLEITNNAGIGITNTGASASLLITGTGTVANVTMNGTVGKGVHNTGQALFILHEGATMNVQSESLGEESFGIVNDSNANIYLDGQNTVLTVTVLDGGTSSGYGFYNKQGNLGILNGATMSVVGFNGTGIRNLSGGTLSVGSDSTLKVDSTGGTGIHNSGTGSTIRVENGGWLYGNYTRETSASGNIIFNEEEGSIIVDKGGKARFVLSGSVPNSYALFNTGSGSTVKVSGAGSVMDAYALNLAGYDMTLFYNTDKAQFTVSDGAILYGHLERGNGISNSLDGHFLVSGSGTMANFRIMGNNSRGVANISGGLFTLNGGASMDINGLSAATKDGITGFYNYGAGVVMADAGTMLNIVLDGPYSTGLYSGNMANFSLSGGAQISVSVENGIGVYNYSTGNFLVSGAGTSLSTSLSGTGSALYSGTFNSTFTINAGAGVNVVNSGSGNGILNERNSTFSLMDGAELVITNTGSGTGLLNDGRYGDANFLIQNATLHSSGNVAGNSIYNNSGNFTLGESARLINDSVFTSTNGVNFSGGNQILSGNGVYNVGDLGLNNATTRLSPGTGSYSDGVYTSQTGTLTIQGYQTWVAMSYDWQLGNPGASGSGGGNGNDFIFINDALSLEGSRYALNASTVLGSAIISPLSDYRWTLLTANAGIYGFNTRNWAVNLDSTWAALGLPGYAQYRVEQAGNSLVLRVLSQLDYYWLQESEYQNWSDDGAWSYNFPPNTAGVTAHFVTNQWGAIVVDLQNESYTVGNLVIGANSSADSNTRYTLSGGNINLSSLGDLSVLTHHAYANGDVISANINASNDVQIDVASAGNSSLAGLSVGWSPGSGEQGSTGTVTDPILSGSGGNPTLRMTETLYMNGKTLTKTGSGTLLVEGNILNAAQIRHNSGSLFLDGTVSVNNGITVAGNAILGGGGSIQGDIIFEHNAIFRAGREGAKYNQRMSVSGSLIAQGKLTFDLSIAVERAFSDDAGDRFSAAYSSGLDLGGMLSLAASDYTVNLYNVSGGFNVVDWSREKNADDGAYYSLISYYGTAVDVSSWSLNWLNGNPSDMSEWELRLTSEGNKHTIWLYYANPVRIPEPGTYAAIAGLLAVGYVFIRRRRR